MTEKDLRKMKSTLSADPTIIGRANIIILAIPTPVDAQNEPDLSRVLSATETVGKNLKAGSTVVYESTVYPGVTEELCGPLLEKHSGLKRGKDFFLGYSPERVNPGDKEHTIEKIVKIVSGEDEKTTELLLAVYGSIVKAGVHRAPSIKVAEMAKAIENAQRDLNIAYINEIAMLCGKLGIETHDVLQAARTKWNFLPFTPGLVGGHCIGVDPYYLVAKAREFGMDTTMISAARKTNDDMASYVAHQVLSALHDPKNSHVLVLGLTFKENIPDTRNAKSQDVINVLKKEGCEVKAHDPFTNGFSLEDEKGVYDAIILLVPHKDYVDKGPAFFAALGKPGCIFYDLKAIFERQDVEKLGMTYLAL
jgi:UDP-N-acetyl-D-galactosamine dehydrogenase